MYAKFRSNFFYYTVALLLSATAIVACKEKKDSVSVTGNKDSLPSLEIINLDAAYTESGKIKMLLKAPLVERFLFAEEPYSLFPNGFHVQFFSDESLLESEIIADYALYKEKPVEMWKAAGNVIVRNYLKKQNLYTDTLYWNRFEHIIYTTAPVRIELEEGLIKGRNGMTSDEKFSTYEIRNVGESHYYFEDK